MLASAHRTCRPGPGGIGLRCDTPQRQRPQKRGVEADAGPRITDRMQSFYDIKEPHDADLAWMRTIYRQIDLSKDANAPLYFPEDVVDGQENLFRIMLGLVVDGKIPAYEYLDGREVYSDKYQIKVQEMLDRFGIYYKTGESGRNGQKFVIEEADVPTSQVLNYYIVEKWEFDKRSNQMKTRVEAICPVAQPLRRLRRRGQIPHVLGEIRPATPLSGTTVCVFER